MSSFSRQKSEPRTNKKLVIVFLVLLGFILYLIYDNFTLRTENASIHNCVDRNVQWYQNALGSCINRIDECKSEVADRCPIKIVNQTCNCPNWIIWTTPGIENYTWIAK